MTRPGLQFVAQLIHRGVLYFLCGSIPTVALASVIYTPLHRIVDFPAPNSSATTPTTFELDWDGDSSPELSVSLTNLSLIPTFPEDTWTRDIAAALKRPTTAASANASFLTQSTSTTLGSPAFILQGVKIGPNETFSDAYSAVLFSADYTGMHSSMPKAPGNFLTPGTPKFIGVSFSIDGKVKYGWALFDFHAGHFFGLQPFATARLYGLAYEDTGETILAGQVSDWLTADFNRDGLVDGEDLAAWGRGYGQSAEHDANGDGQSDGADFLEWQRQVGKSSFLPAASAATAAVPEPSSLAVSMIAAAIITSASGSSARGARRGRLRV